jgi:mRNA interferase YafQ
MRTLIWDESFRRALKKSLKKRPQLQEKIADILNLLAIDPFTPALKTHKLQGELKGLWACSVEYDCRVIFAFNPGADAIILIDIGSHDEVY